MLLAALLVCAAAFQAPKLPKDWVEKHQQLVQRELAWHRRVIFMYLECAHFSAAKNKNALETLPKMKKHKMEAASDSNDRFGFIVGSPRSGTSITKLLLDQHPNVSSIYNRDIYENEGLS